MLPRVIIHNVVSVDGRMDWIKPDLGLFYGVAARLKEDATLVGCDTLLAVHPGGSEFQEDEVDVLEAEDEKAEERWEEAEKKDETAPEVPNDRNIGAEPDGERAKTVKPLLVVTDSRGRLATWDYWRGQPYWRDGVALCSLKTPKTYLDYLRTRQIESIVAGNDLVDLRVALCELNARHGIQTVRVDSGGTLGGAMLRMGLVNEISMLIHPSLVGGTSPQSLFRAPDLQSTSGLISCRLIHLEALTNSTVWLRYRILH